MTDLPPPPPMTASEIVGIIRDHWMSDGMDWDNATWRGELGFAYMLDEGSIREEGFTVEGETLYETCTPAAETILVVLMQKKEGRHL